MKDCGRRLYKRGGGSSGGTSSGSSKGTSHVASGRAKLGKADDGQGYRMMITPEPTAEMLFSSTGGYNGE